MEKVKKNISTALIMLLRGINWEAGYECDGDIEGDIMKALDFWDKRWKQSSAELGQAQP